MARTPGTMDGKLTNDLQLVRATSSDGSIQRLTYFQSRPISATFKPIESRVE